MKTDYHDLMTDCLDCFVRDSVKTAIMDSVINNCELHAERSRSMGRLEGAGVVTGIVLLIKLLSIP